jgi:uncharacterized Ntn-hydrolase superfamily protein
MRALFVLCVLLIALPGSAAEPAPRVSPLRPVTTYSIVARDPDTGEIGAAVQSHWFSVGPLVIWAEAGVGAVATQSMVEPAYGPRGLELMKMGVDAMSAIEGLLNDDPHPDIRQVGMVDYRGNAVAHTGERCIAEAGHRVGRGYAVQANLMERSTVPEAMARAFEEAAGPLAERLLAALYAAEDEGGDIRGRQSAAVVVVSGDPTGNEWEDRLVDLRVEDHPDPVNELRRLLNIHRGYEQMNAGDVAMEIGDIDGARAAYGKAESILPGNVEARFWHAVALVNAGLADEAVPMFAEIFARDENWRTLTPRLVDPGFLSADTATLERILTAGR